MKVKIIYQKIRESEKIRFVIIGSGASLIHLTVAESMILWLNFFSVYAINLMSFSFAFLFSYMGHRFFTFAHKGNIIKFFMTATLGFCVNNIILNAGIFVGLKSQISILLAITIVPIITFILSKYWAFRLTTNQ